MDVIQLNKISEVVGIDKAGLDEIKSNKADTETIMMNKAQVDIIALPISQDALGNVFVMEGGSIPFVSEDGSNKFKTE
jgi:hypothetical protein